MCEMRLERMIDAHRPTTAGAPGIRPDSIDEEIRRSDLDIAIRVEVYETQVQVVPGQFISVHLPSTFFSR